MSINSKRGTIVRIDESATQDTFVGEAVVNLTLKTETGERIQARYIPRGGFALSVDLWWKLFNSRDASGEALKAVDSEVVVNRGRTYANEPYRQPVDFRQYDQWECLFRPSIGDTVECGWDYRQFKGEIITFAENRQPVSRDFPIESKRTFAIDDLLDSLNPGVK